MQSKARQKSHSINLGLGTTGSHWEWQIKDKQHVILVVNLPHVPCTARKQRETSVPFSDTCTSPTYQECSHTPGLKSPDELDMTLLHNQLPGAYSVIASEQ
jgi:hypothetical protein